MSAIRKPEVLVTGGSGAIGAAIVRSLVAQGARVTVLDRSAPQAFPDLNVAFVECDLADLASIDATVARLAETGARFSGVVHSAGVSHLHYLADEARDEWLRVIAVNLTGAIALTQGLLPLLADGASMVFITSGTVYKGIPAHSAYVASKAGIVGFVRSLSAELGERGIRVNCVAPGLIVTPLEPGLARMEAAQIQSRALQRPQTPQDTVGAVEFLLSPASAFITGQSLVVDGGSVRH